MIEALTQGIARIGPLFEVFAGLVMTALTGTPTTQAGVNLMGYPVAKVSDGETDDGQAVFEYSDRKTYFVGKMEKAASDLRKVLKQKPAAITIFLISGASYKPQIAGNFTKRARRWKAMAGKTLHLWGREQLAEQIVDHLLVNERMVRRLSAFLPELQQIADEEAATGLAPKPEAPRLPRADVDEEIVRQLGESPVIVLAGMAGLGKSHAAAAYAADHADDYDLIIWLEGREVPRVETLQALPLVRAGEQRNIAALLKTRACLLIIDDVDPGLRPNDLVALCGPESRVILTQQTVATETYELPLLSKSDAKALLNMAGTPSPEEVFETIWASAQGHDLTDRLEAHLVDASAELALRFWETARSLQAKLVELVRTGERRAAFLYALLTIWEPAEVDPALVGEPLSMANDLHAGARHPQLQAVLLRYLSDIQKTVEGEKPVQIFVTSHSPNFASIAELNTLVCLVDQRGYVEAFQPRAITFEKGKREKLERYLDVTRAEIFFARRIIFVEGAAELMLVSVLAELAGHKLRDHGVSLISVEGLNFDSFLPLFGEKALKIPVSVITDADPFGPDGKALYPAAGVAVTVSDNTAKMKKLEDGFVRVFHGQKTLEYDLALESENLATMLAALKDIHPQIGTDLATTVDSAVDSAAKAKAMFTGMFERPQNNVQKGRFGQALAQALVKPDATHKVPSYILDAIAHACQAEP